MTQMSDYYGPDPETIEQMHKENQLLAIENEALIERLNNEGAMFDRLMAILTFRNICHRCGLSRDDCVDDETCDNEVKKIDNWLDEMNEVLLEGVDD